MHQRYHTVWTCCSIPPGYVGALELEIELVEYELAVIITRVVVIPCDHLRAGVGYDYFLILLGCSTKDEAKRESSGQQQTDETFRTLHVLNLLN